MNKTLWVNRPHQDPSVGLMSSASWQKQGNAYLSPCMHKGEHRGRRARGCCNSATQHSLQMSLWHTVPNLRAHSNIKTLPSMMAWPQAQGPSWAGPSCPVHPPRTHLHHFLLLGGIPQGHVHDEGQHHGDKCGTRESKDSRLKS